MSAVTTITFSAGDAGHWHIERVMPVIGETLPGAARLAIDDTPHRTAASDWALRGVISNHRYTQAAELGELRSVSPSLSRPEARCAALIPIRKSPEWWGLAQDERRAIFEEQSGHIAKSMKYLPAIARRLHHSRDLGEPFDFLTWFEYAPEHEPAFDALLIELRASAEWRYVDREVDIRLKSAVD
ncbi:MAG: chlorite dismutase family protein [Beijerinckiaceae bacterium]|nr:chlorite dismutase family protein [Beijerinckiaceae bacterium]